ncbi:DNA helicase IV [Vibrio sp. 10N.286.49.B3]|uniref:DNA helicase IV n=1 Tax=Vibrio sp. 10N.286.49.B3 TaxID=1880855 RepID=UPI000C867392|nr:DNA helicase IV [Vibrio sp. 10N.286.49.B3]PMH44507.1 DNA helicase IV [Vibrio sp. 10N.286.49.B3]
MQLCANAMAQFFIHNEYHQVEIESQRLIVSAKGSEERIPFTVWNGKVKIHRGLCWGSIQFFAHQDQKQDESNIEHSWLVQGLPWSQCRAFARYAVAAYQKWHDEQCQNLAEYLPKWEQELHRLEHLPAFLPHSKLEQWSQTVRDEFSTLTMTVEEAKQRIPQRVALLEPWLDKESGKLALRNKEWLNREIQNWTVLFAQCESSPLNLSQQYAVLLNDDNNLVLAGAGSGKTSVLMARVSYLLQSHQAQANEILMVAFGREAAGEMRERLEVKLGQSSDQVQVNTFHQLGLNIIKAVEKNEITISPIALDSKLKEAWCIDWLKKHWMTPTNFKRWQKHLTQWPIAYLTGDDDLGSHVENPKLVSWLVRQLEQLAALGMTKKAIQTKLIDHSDYTRLNSELALCWPIYSAWQQMLKESKHIDFPSMISKATEYVKKGRFRSQWAFIMVDEYQDISPDRLALIQALCDQNKGSEKSTSLYAVGDDWQSIYQFAGSDIDLTTEFTSRFTHSTIHYLDTTYRFNNQIGDVANGFIQANPRQLEKTLNSHKQQKQKAVITEPSEKVEKILDQLNRQSKSKVKSVLLLGRNHYHQPNQLNEWKKLFKQLELRFMTCHASKGKEADFVIILAVDEGQFPAKKKQTHLDGALTQSSDPFPYSEERRLFYVAMTRAKEKVWITHNGEGSGFVQELHSNGYPIIKKK